MQDRIVFLGAAIDDDVAEGVISSLRILAARPPRSHISLYINSPGGAVTAGLTLMDAIQSIGVEVHTYCIGCAHGMAALVLAAGTPGHRYTLADGIFTLGPLRAGDTQTSALSAEFARLTAKLIVRASELTKSTTTRIGELFAAGTVLDATQALELGLVDEVVIRRA